MDTNELYAAARQDTLRGFTLFRRLLLADTLAADGRRDLAFCLDVIEETMALDGSCTPEEALAICEALGHFRKMLRGSEPLIDEARELLAELLDIAEERLT